MTRDNKYINSSKKNSKLQGNENVTFKKETTCSYAGQISNFLLLIQNGKINVKCPNIKNNSAWKENKEVTL